MKEIVFPILLSAVGLMNAQFKKVEDRQDLDLVDYQPHPMLVTIKKQNFR